MHKIKYRVLTMLFLSVFLFTSACADHGGNTVRNQNQQNTPGSNQLQTNSSELAVIQIMTNREGSYVSLDKLVKALDFNDEWDETTQTHHIGDNDIVYVLKVNSTQAVKEEQNVQLTNEPILQNGETWVPLEVANHLFAEEMNYEINNQQLIIYPNNVDFNTDVEEPDFADDPADPSGNQDVDDEEARDIDQQDEEVWLPSTDHESVTVFTRKNVNANRLIATGKKYLGVKYDFGAGKYARTKRFDCSSFVQQLYNTYGVRLPRTSRNQAKYGISVSRKNLRKGDLMYFYVPGRFRTNKTVGHVGVYIGSNKMLHSSPKPKNGVQITNINKSYWKKTYLGAKRVIK
jgi:cell wall-associated NlpC family hydrolase